MLTETWVVPLPWNTSPESATVKEPPITEPIKKTLDALVEAHSYAKDIEEAQGYEMRYQQALSRAQIQEDKNLSRATTASDPGLIGTPRSNIFAGDM